MQLMHQDQVFCSMWGDPEEWSKQAGIIIPTPSIIFHDIAFKLFESKPLMSLNTREFYAHVAISAKDFLPTKYLISNAIQYALFSYQF